MLDLFQTSLRSSANGPFNSNYVGWRCRNKTKSYKRKRPVERRSCQHDVVPHWGSSHPSPIVCERLRESLTQALTSCFVQLSASYGEFLNGCVPWCQFASLLMNAGVTKAERTPRCTGFEECWRFRTQGCASFRGMLAFLDPRKRQDAQLFGDAGVFERKDARLFGNAGVSGPEETPGCTAFRGCWRFSPPPPPRTIMTTRTAGGLLLGYNPKGPGPGTQVPGPHFVQAQ